MKECQAYKILDQGFVQCETCHHYCKIAEDRTGICGIRQNLEGKLYLLVYSRVAAINIDPIEKKPLYHFLPGSKAFSLGTFGCNFFCGNCQNYSISQIDRQKISAAGYERLNWGQDLSPAEAVRLAKANDCASIAYTYNEPTIFFEYALDTMKLAHKSGLKNVWVSNGYMTDKTLDMIIPYLDAINVDIKSFDNEFYKNNCGASLEPVLHNCRRLVKEKVWTEITTLVIPTLSADNKMLKKIAEFIKNELGNFVPWHVSAFSAGLSWKLKGMPDTEPAAIEQICAIGREVGLKHVYAGNI
jgi:pyruvate formate lyase activating enzyme